MGRLDGGPRHLAGGSRGSRERFGRAQDFQPERVGFFVVGIKMRGQIQIPIAKFFFGAMPTRQELPQEFERASSVELPVPA